MRPLELPKRGIENTSPGSVLTALLMSILLHGTLWQTAPAYLSVASASPPPPQKATEVVLEEIKPEDIPEELLPEEFRRPKPRFVHINPEAPTLLPPETLNTGAATQRAAQPEPAPPSPSSLPKVDGEEADSTRVVNHIPRELLPPQLQPQPHVPLGKPDPEDPAPVAKTATPDQQTRQMPNAARADNAQDVPPPQQTPPDATGEQPARAKEGPSPAQERVKLAPSTAKGGLTATMQPGKAPVDPRISNATGDIPVKHPEAEKRPGEREARANTPPVRSATATAKKSAPAPRPQAVQSVARPEKQTAIAKGADDGLPAPLPRPQAAKVGTTGILMRNPSGVNQAGVLTLDAKYSEFGDYAQRMIEIIQASWWLIIERAQIHEAYGAVVVIEFTLCKDGTLKDVIVSSSSAKQAGTYACKDAIESRAPFDPWRPDMVAMLGEEEHSKFTFHYR
ncbi:MAG: hypothetical protein LBV54_08620 [Puniceicoccales bacterium]|nr:hypothetical protein [Puniceicoccales bacterium]